MKPFLYIGGSQSYDLGGGVFQVVGTGFVDSDGVGPHADKHDAQNQTTYQPSLNASRVPYVCCPPQFRESQQTGVVIGCEVLVELLSVDGKATVLSSTLAVCGDIEPRTKWGEMSEECARRLGLDPSPIFGGTNAHRVRYTYRTGKAASIDGTIYRLQRA